jgi:hypothetical protein
MDTCEDCNGSRCWTCDTHYCCEDCPCGRSHNCACDCAYYDQQMTYAD